MWKLHRPLDSRVTAKSPHFCINPAQAIKMAFITSPSHDLHAYANTKDQSLFRYNELVEAINHTGSAKTLHCPIESSHAREDDLVRLFQLIG